MLTAAVSYPVVVSLAYAGSRAVDKVIPSRWTGDMAQYLGSGVFGLAIEWMLLGNDPGSNAF